MNNNESFYRSLFINNKAMMLLIDLETFEREDCNLSACSFYGYSYEEILNLKITDIMTLTEQQIVREMSLAKAEQNYQFYSKHRLSSGQIRDVEGDAAKARKQGYSWYLSKPVRKDELQNCTAIVLGLKPDTEESRQIVTEYTHHENKSALKPKILLVEDNGINRKVIITMLKSYDITCDLAMDGNEAYQAVLNKHYDLVFMDCHMPVMDGYEATEKIRNAEAGSKHTKIIAMTANAMKGDREKCLEAGMDDYISKPVNFEIMFKIIEETTGLRRDPLIDEKFTRYLDMMPNLYGIDTKIAVSRLGGDQKFFRKLLTNFRKNQKYVITEIRQALEDGDVKTAERLAHTFKGIAGDIAAQKVYRLAGDLETEIHIENLHNVKALLRQLEQVLEQVFTSIASLEKSFEKGPTSELKPVNYSILNPLLDKLVKLLNKNDMDAVECLEEIARQTEQTSLAQKVTEMKEYGDQYYFLEALKVLDDINENAKSLRLDEEHNGGN